MEILFPFLPFVVVIRSFEAQTRGRNAAGLDAFTTDIIRLSYLIPRRQKYHPVLGGTLEVGDRAFRERHARCLYPRRESVSVSWCKRFTQAADTAPLKTQPGLYIPLYSAPQCAVCL